MRQRRLPLEKSQAKFAGAEGVSDLRGALDQVGIDISEALQKSPVRALSVALGQIAQTVVGGRAGILQRAGQARAARSDADRVVSMLESAGSELAGTRLHIERLSENFGVGFTRDADGAVLVNDRELATKSAEQQKALSDLLEAQGDLTNQVEFLRPKAAEATRAAQASAQGILTPGQQLKSQAVGVVGIVGGTLLFTTAMQAAQLALQQLSVVVMNTADELGGFAFTMNRVSGELADVISKSSGNIDAALAGVRGAAGLPAGVDLAAISSRATLQAGAAQFERQRDLLRADQSARAGAPGIIPGIGVGFSNGLFNTSIGQQQGLVELMAGALGSLPIFQEVPPRSEATNPGVLESGRTVFPGGIGSIDDYIAGVGAAAANRSAGAGTFFNPSSIFEFPEAGSQEELARFLGINPDDLAGLTQAGQFSDIRDEILRAAKQQGFGLRAPANSDLEQGLFGVERALAEAGIGAVTAEPLQSESDNATDSALKNNEEASARLRDQLDLWNQQLEKAGSTFRYQQVSLAEAQQFADETLASIGAPPDQRGQFLSKNLALVGPNGQVASGYQFNRESTRVLEESLRPSVEDLIEEMRKGTEAQIASIKRNEEFARRVEIPSAFFEQLAAQPLLPAGAGIVGPNAGGLEAGIAGRYASQIRSVQREIQPFYDQGRQELLDIGVDENDINAVEQLGKEITNLRVQSSKLQLGLEQAQYNEQLYLTKRALSDVLGLMGKTGAETSELGRLQRQQINDQRELARISLARSQRELNFQLALARLRAPGETAEERAVRIREAEVRTREAQRELDINRRSANRGFRIEDIGFARQARDLSTQIGLIQRARAVNIEVRGIERVIDAKNQLLGLRRQFLGVGRQSAIEIQKVGFGIIQAVETRLGTFNEKVAKFADENLQIWLERINQVRLAARGLSNASGDLVGPRGKGPGAAGAYFVTSGPTSFVAGEAGSEHVLILRNPKTGMMSTEGGGRGGGSVYIKLNLNATVSGEGDEDRLARKVARRLHDEVALLMGA